MEVALAILVAVLSIMLIGIVLWCGFVAVDSWGRPHHSDVARVISKHHEAAHIQTILVYNAATKTSLPQLIPHPESWSVNVAVAGSFDSVPVSKDFYDRALVGQLGKADFVCGRLSGRVYVKSVSMESF
jgi:hypothetical protein